MFGEEKQDFCNYWKIQKLFKNSVGLILKWQKLKKLSEIGEIYLKNYIIKQE